jgi:hypothetical protein
MQDHNENNGVHLRIPEFRSHKKRDLYSFQEGNWLIFSALETDGNFCATTGLSRYNTKCAECALTRENDKNIILTRNALQYQHWTWHNGDINTE